MQGRIQDFGRGAQVERRRREFRGAAGAEGGRVWGGGVPLPNGGRVQKNFLTFLLGIVHFGAYSDTISHAHKAYSRLKEKQNPTIK